MAMSRLEQRPFGRTGEQVAAISLGGVGLPRVSFADGVATVHRALELGINYLDTAPLYSRGLAQAILGVALEGRQEPHLLATKLGHLAQPRPLSLARCPTHPVRGKPAALAPRERRRAHGA